MRRNYRGKEKGAEVFPERGYTHKGLGAEERGAAEATGSQGT